MDREAFLKQVLWGLCYCLDSRIDICRHAAGRRGHGACCQTDGGRD
jgi:hypothetical protein